MSALAILLGGGGLVLYLAFLALGPFSKGFLAGDGARLALDAALCALFFLQHSGMVRRGFRARLGTSVPPHLLSAVYAVASGVALVLLVLLWQPTGPALYRLEGAALAAPVALWLLAAALSAWAARALHGLDLLGLGAIRARRRARSPSPPSFAVAGPYRYVRHPLYLAVLLFLWSAPQLTPDRLLLDALFTVWMVAATRLEERDLVADFGEAYREYQRRVAMLLPTRAPWPPDGGTPAA